MRIPGPPLALASLLLLSACTPLATPGRVPRPGQTAPGFSLPGHRDITVHLRRVREAGPVVVVFYRGHW